MAHISQHHQLDHFAASRDILSLRCPLIDRSPIWNSLDGMNFIQKVSWSQLRADGKMLFFVDLIIPTP
jgi:hypothetical protein